MLSDWSKLRGNVNAIEDKLQTLIDADSIELGIKLHRHVAMGSGQEDKDWWKPKYLAKIFLTTCLADVVAKNFEVIP
eukprot:4828439-Pyramimonas_sp.AAC.1